MEQNEIFLIPFRETHSFFRLTTLEMSLNYRQKKIILQPQNDTRKVYNDGRCIYIYTLEKDTKNV